MVQNASLMNGDPQPKQGPQQIRLTDQSERIVAAMIARAKQSNGLTLSTAAAANAIIAMWEAERIMQDGAHPRLPGME